MTTSLAAQLQRLATPQTSILVESKKEFSILFDWKIAATKDRQIIYEIGTNGLGELISLNPIFKQFESTLFNQSTLDMERSVETSQVNEVLNYNIRKFLYQLSPYFLLRPAHQCLEWLIRRFKINQYNINDFLGLIFPYHETMMFVKCVQTMNLSSKKHWNWITPIQKPGVPISKQTIINRAATDTFLLKFISETTVFAVEELDTKAYTLQALFAFYSTITLGALNDIPDITDAHILNIASTLVNGLSSNVVDFCAASMIVTGLLVKKIELSKEFLKRIIWKLVNICHPELQRESLIILIIISQTQNESMNSMNDALLAKMVDNLSMINTVSGLYDKNINVLPLILPLMSSCLENIQKKKKAKLYKTFVETLLSEISLKRDDAEAMIRCILNAYEPSTSDIIDINSEDEIDGDVIMADDIANESQWYSNLLRSFEIRHPEVYDSVTRAIMSNQDEDSSSQRKSLKTVLGALFCTAYSTDPSGAKICVDLYHPSDINRMQAVKDLVNKLSSMPFSDDKKNLLVAGIIECLSDSSPAVVEAVLQFKTPALIKIVGEQNLIRKLKVIIGEEFLIKEEWQNAISCAVKHITSDQLLSDNNEIEILLAIWPYMFPFNVIMVKHTKKILHSRISDRFPIIKRLQNYKFKDNDDDLIQLNTFVSKQLETFLGMANIHQIVQYVETIPDAEISTMLAFHIINLLTHAMTKNSGHELSTKIMGIVSRFSKQFQSNKLIIADFKNIIELINIVNASDYLPIQVTISCIQSIIAKTSFSAINSFDFDCKNDELNLAIKIYDNLCTGLYAQNKNVNQLFNKVILEFFATVLPNLEDQLSFFSNFFISHYVDKISDTPHDFSIDETLQLRSMRLFNALLSQTDDLTDITMEMFIRIVSALTSVYEAIRITACDTIDILYKRLERSSKFSSFFGFILESKQEISLSHAELPLKMYLFLLQKRKKFILELFEFIRLPESSLILKASVMDMLEHINEISYLKIVVDPALNILNKVDGNQTIIFNRHESIIVYQTINRFNDDTVSSIFKSENCRRFFEKSLQQSNVFLRLGKKLRSISVVTMDKFYNITFDKLSIEMQLLIIESIVRSATFSESSEVRSKAERSFKKWIKLNGEIELNILSQMANVPIKISIEDPKRAKRQSYSPEMLHTPEWKCGLTLLEFLQIINKKQLQNTHALMRQLFPVLKKCLDFDDQSLVEYAKQLVLGGILNCCEMVSSTGSIPDGDFKIDVVVQCIRGTQNPQTHHHALQLLTKLATLIPDSVLHWMTDIFTFVGSSVTRRDDTYIYQLISNVIKSIVPILTQSNNVSQLKLIVPVLKVFSDIILDVPEHRRLRLYEDLITTLDPMKFLWTFLAVLFEFKPKETIDDKQFMKRTVIGINIANVFECDVIIETCLGLIKFLRNQLKDVNADEISKSIFNVKYFNSKYYTHNECARYRNLIFKFINVLTLETSVFATKMRALSQVELFKYKESFQCIIPALLDYIKAASGQMNTQNTEKVWSDNLSHCYHILDHLLDLLYPDMLLQVIGALLSEDNEIEVRIKTIDLLNKKLDFPEFFTNCQNSILLLLESLTDIVKSINDADKLVKKATKRQNIRLQEEALIAIQLMSKIFAKDHTNEFSDLLGKLGKILHSYAKVPESNRILARLIHCVAEVCANLRINGIAYLHSFMPLTTKLLNKLTMEQSDESFPVFAVILTAIYRIVETLPLFLNPYLVNLITSLSILWSNLQSTQNDSQKSLVKLNSIWQKLSSTLELRVLIPMIDKTYCNLLSEKAFNPIGPLMILLLDSFGHLKSADLSQNCNELTAFFIKAMELRSTFHNECQSIDVQEGMIIQTFVGLILKLSEVSFRPLYDKVYEWSIESVGLSYDRAVTFYRLTLKIAESLKSLFMSFAKNVVQNAADLLKRDFTEAEINASSTNPTELIHTIMEALFTVFLYNSNGFINSRRFNILMEPLVNLLDNEKYLKVKSIQEMLPKCLGQLAVAANDDILWKQLNYQILLKTRSNSTLVRRCALICSVEVVKNIGEDFTQFLSETIPFYAELMEDENTEIAELCDASIRDIEKFVKEPLQKYFS